MISTPGNRRIHDAIRGKRIKAVWTDEQRLLIEMEDGHVARIIWTTDGPVLEGMDVRILLPTAPLFGVAGSL